MADLISRTVAIARIDEYLYGIDLCISELALKLDGYRNGLQVAIQELNALPAVDAVPVVHARWQGVSPFVDTEECSNCRYNIQSEELETPYCPWCGAIMDGERRDSE